MTQSKGSFRPQAASIPTERGAVAAAHTPGPWERLEGAVEVGHPIYKPGTVVTRIVQKRAPGQTEFVKIALVDTGAANARLIAAAPALLEACKQAEAQFADLAAITINGEHDARDQAAIEALRAAIQSATGEG